mgnify:CR=1 FL=1
MYRSLDPSKKTASLSFWRKNPATLIRQAKGRIDPRLNLTDAISIAAELGLVDTLEKLLDSLGNSAQTIKGDGKSKIEQCLAGDDAGQTASMFGSTPLHKAAYRFSTF